MRTIPACDHCGSPLPERHRRYCKHCSPLASLLWKRAKRREWRGTHYYLDPWLKRAGGDEAEARRLWSEYMHNYKIRQRLVIIPENNADVVEMAVHEERNSDE